jgi:branched-chain amino acid transport system ATP-binding protein
VSEAVLRVEGLSRSYGSLVAVEGVDLTVQSGARHALIGPNGAGKTTLFDMVGGRTRPSRGRIVLRTADGERDVTRLPEHERARLGVAKTFQHSNLFDGLSSQTNVAMAVQRHAGIAGRPWFRARRYTDVTERACELLGRVGLDDRAAAAAGALSHGERRQLEVAVALATHPHLLLLDEPTAGMSPAESTAFVALIRSLPDDLSVLVIEHDMDVVFSLATRVSVMAAGRLLAEGAPAEIRADAVVQEAYLGTGSGADLFVSP